MINTFIVAIFIFGLNSPKYHVRDNYTKLLSHAHPYSYLVSNLANSGIPEVVMRADIARINGVRNILQRIGPCPSIDAVWYNTETYTYESAGPLESPFDEQIRVIAGPIYKGRRYDGYPHESFRSACVDLFCELIRLGYKEEVLKDYLIELRRRDAIYYQKSGRKNPLDKTEISK